MLYFKQAGGQFFKFFTAKVAMESDYVMNGHHFTLRLACCTVID